MTFLEYKDMKVYIKIGIYPKSIQTCQLSM